MRDDGERERVNETGFDKMKEEEEEEASYTVPD